jgi:hypothetical protein
MILKAVETDKVMATFDIRNRIRTLSLSLPSLISLSLSLSDPSP